MNTKTIAPTVAGLRELLALVDPAALTGADQRALLDFVEAAMAAAAAERSAKGD